MYKINIFEVPSFGLVKLVSFQLGFSSLERRLFHWAWVASPNPMKDYPVIPIGA